MTKYTFAPKDFKAFDVDGLENRMEALNEHVRPQLNLSLIHISEPTRPY